MKYQVFYSERADEDLDFRADLYAENPNDKEVKKLEFEAKNDKEAKEKINDMILPGDERPLRGVGQLKACRPKGKNSKGEGKKNPKVVVDLNLLKEPLKSQVLNALNPLVESGTFVSEDSKLLVKDKELLNLPERKKRKKKEKTTETVETGEKTETTIQHPAAVEVPQQEAATA